MRDAISNAQKEALKAKEKTALSTIRLITAALKDRDIAADQRAQAMVFQMMKFIHVADND